MFGDELAGKSPEHFVVAAIVAPALYVVMILIEVYHLMAHSQEQISRRGYQCPTNPDNMLAGVHAAETAILFAAPDPEYNILAGWQVPLVHGPALSQVLIGGLHSGR
jgi:hypothetical protein